MKTRRAFTKARNRSEMRFRLIGLGAVLVSMGFLVLLLSTIVGSGLPAFTYNYAKLTVDLSEAKPDAVDEVDYATVFRETTKETFPQFSGRKDRRLVRGIFASGSDYLLQKQVAADQSLAGGRNEILIPVSDFADLYLKGLTAKAERSAPAVPVSFTRDGDVVYGAAASAIFEPFIATVKGQLAGEITALENRVTAQQRGLDAVTGDSENAQARRRGFQTEITKLESWLEQLKPQAGEGGSLENLTGTLPSLLILPDGENEGAILRARSVTATGFTAEMMIPFETESASFTAPVELLMIEVPESDRKFSDREVAFMEHMRSRDMIETGFNDIFFSAGASREAETAGIWGRGCRVFPDVGDHAGAFLPDRRCRSTVSRGIRTEEQDYRFHRGQHQQSGGSSLHRFRSAGPCGLPKLVQPAEIGAAGGRTGACPDDPADDHHRLAGSAESGAAVDPRGGPRGRRIQAANGLPPRSAAGHAGHPDRIDHRHGTGAGRDSAAADDRHGGVHSRDSRWLYRSGDSAAGADFHVGGFSRTCLSAEDGSSHHGIAGVSGADERAWRSFCANDLSVAGSGKYKSNRDKSLETRCI